MPRICRPGHLKGSADADWRDTPPGGEVDLIVFPVGGQGANVVWGVQSALSITFGGFCRV